jgi:hypothetical protein
MAGFVSPGTKLQNYPAFCFLAPQALISHLENMLSQLHVLPVIKTIHSNVQLYCSICLDDYARFSTISSGRFLASQLCGNNPADACVTCYSCRIEL